MIKFIKIVAPGVSLLWLLFFIEILIQKNSFSVSLLKSECLFLNLKFFLLYTIIGIIIGFLSSGILVNKKERFRKVEFLKKNYSHYFSLSLVICIIIIISFIFRELIIQPALFEKTLLKEGFLKKILIFITKSFKPLYFTSILFAITTYSSYRLISYYKIKKGPIRYLVFVISVLSMIYLIFGYGALYADNQNKEDYNLLVFGVEGVSNRNIYSKYSAFKELSKSAYVFKNFYAESDNWEENILSFYYSKHQLNLNLVAFKSFNKYKAEKNDTVYYSLDKSLTEELALSGRRNLLSVDPKYAKLFHYTKDFHKTLIPPQKQITNVGKIIQSHFTFLSFSSNNFLLMLFPEIYSLDDYQEKEHSRGEIFNFMQNNKRFSTFCFLEKKPKKLPYPYYLELENKNGNQVFMDYVNEELELCIEFLKNKKLLKKTVILFMGIPEENNLSIKNLKVPLFLYAPWLNKTKVIQNNYTFSDLTPTLLKMLTNLKKFPTLEGKSFLDKDFSPKSIIYYKNNKAFLIRGNYRLKVELKENSIEYTLYNIMKDPNEKNDLLLINKKLAHKLIKRFEKEMQDKLHYILLNGYPLSK